MINLTNEDNMELMSRYPDNYFDLAIVDPPYGIGAAKERTQNPERWKSHRPNGYAPKDWDNAPPSIEYFNEVRRISKNQIIFGGNYFADLLPCSKGWIVWNKKVNIKEPLSMAELAWSSFQVKCNLFSYLWAGFRKEDPVKRIHPTQKPVKLYEWLLMNYAKEGDKILDTHLGSGSIALACHNLGFDLVGCELDAEYYDAACKRLKRHQAQLTMF